MAQERVREWAKRFVPEKPDEEHRTKRIRVATETQILDTWEAPFPGRETWIEEMESLLSCSADQMPIRRHTVTFTAEDAQGVVLSQCPTTVQGKNKDASDLMGGNGVKAITDSMNALAQTMDKVLATARLQCDSCTKALGAMSDEVQDLHAVLRAQRAKDSVGNDSDSDAVTAIAIQKLEQYAEPIIELGKMYLETKGATPRPSTPSAKVITNAVTDINRKAAS